jgi:hypothetical protein
LDFFLGAGASADDAQTISKLLVLPSMRLGN